MIDALKIPPPLLTHLLPRYLWVRWAQNVLKNVRLFVNLLLLSFKTARNCFQMVPEPCLSYIKSKRATKLPGEKLAHMTKVFCNSGTNNETQPDPPFPRCVWGSWALFACLLYRRPSLFNATGPYPRCLVMLLCHAPIVCFPEGILASHPLTLYAFSLASLANMSRLTPDAA